MKSRWLAWGIGSTMAVAACASVKMTDGIVTGAGGANGGGGATAGASGGSDGGPSSADSGGATGTACAVNCADFPVDPILTPGVPPAAAAMFGAPGSGSQGTGPCLREPQDGTLFPSNWLRPRFSFTAPAGQDLYEIRLHANQEKNDLVVYTDTPTWTMPKDMWTGLTRNVINQPITVTVRSLATGAATKTVNVSPPFKFTIAPVGVGGSIVYWTTSGVSALKGFRVGDETVSTVMTPAMVDPTINCIGCHVSTPDGAFIAMAANLAPTGADPASLGILSGSTYKEPPYLSASAKQLLARMEQPVAAFSPAHWTTGDRIVLSLLENRDIIWTDLEATSTAQGTAWGTITRTGDTGLPIAQSWSHDGMTVVYTSVTGGVTDTGVRVQSGLGSLFTVPYGGRMGGPAMALNGGNDPMFHAYYATFAPDDRYIAFTRAPSSGTSYDNPLAEIFLLPRQGAPTPTRLLANDPPRCTNQSSPGVTNSWPKWAPAVASREGTAYYWLTFSSRRGNGIPQIFVTAITVTETGVVQTYPALYVWNQPATESNHTPAWDVFDIVVR